MRLHIEEAPKGRFPLHPHTWDLTWNMLQRVSFACYFGHTAPYSLQLMWRHITSHRRHPNTSYTSHHSSPVTKQHDHIEAEGRDEPERTCVGRGERCVKIKGCRQSKAMCTPIRKNPNPLLFLPGWRMIRCLWEKALMTYEARFSSCRKNTLLRNTVNLVKLL